VVTKMARPGEVAGTPQALAVDREHGRIGAGPAGGDIRHGLSLDDRAVACPLSWLIY